MATEKKIHVETIYTCENCGKIEEKDAKLTLENITSIICKKCGGNVMCETTRTSKDTI